MLIEHGRFTLEKDNCMQVEVKLTFTCSVQLLKSRHLKLVYVLEAPTAGILSLCHEAVDNNDDRVEEFAVKVYFTINLRTGCCRTVTFKPKL